MRGEDKIAEALDRHKAGVLMFSGGRDSTAVLELARPFLKDIVVTWVNTGAAHPETIRQMGVVRRSVPHFHEVVTNVQQQIAEHGYPVDVLPLRFTPIGHLMESDSPPKAKLQSFIDCCMKSIWKPGWDAVVAMGLTLIFRGERAAEARKGPARTGTVADGIEIVQPVFDWTDEFLMAFLAERKAFVSKSYDFHGKGLECWCCSAFWHESAGHLRYLQANEPPLHAELVERLREVRAAVDSEVSGLHALLKTAQQGD